MEQDRSNRPTDCHDSECPFNKYTDRICTRCGRKKIRGLTPMFLWLVGLIVIAIPSALLGSCLTSFSTMGNNKPDPFFQGVTIASIIFGVVCLVMAIYSATKKDTPRE